MSLSVIVLPSLVEAERLLTRRVLETVRLLFVIDPARFFV